MKHNWMSPFRILILVILVLGVAQWLPASPHARANATIANGQSESVNPPKRASGAAQKPGEAPATAEEEGDAQADNQQMAEQLAQVRQQVTREMMDRMRYGGAHTDFEGMLDGFLAFSAFIGFLLIALWVLRISLEHKRWGRAVHAQAEMHAKLLDKFGTSQDLIAYVESEAGKRFLEAPVFQSQTQRSLALPFGRILWTVQAGVVAAILGVGILALRGHAPSSDSSFGFEVFGTLITTLGVGFLVSGAVSYLLAKYMGLLNPPEEASSRAATRS
jgi:hypothetical protein